MGKIKDAIQDWIEDYGHTLGYDMSNYPAIEDWDNIKLNNIDAKEYYENYQSRSNRKKRK